MSLKQVGTRIYSPLPGQVGAHSIQFSHPNNPLSFAPGFSPCFACCVVFEAAPAYFGCLVAGVAFLGSTFCSSFDALCYPAH